MFMINNKIYTHEIEYTFLFVILLAISKVFCKVNDKLFQNFSEIFSAEHFDIFITHKIAMERNLTHCTALLN